MKMTIIPSRIKACLQLSFQDDPGYKKEPSRFQSVQMKAFPELWIILQAPKGLNHQKA